MAHVQDLWEKTVDGRRARTDRYGRGRRWQARYLDPEGRERTRMFARKQDAERFLATITADVLRGAFVDPDAGKVTFADFAERWLAAQTFSESSREATELRLRLHAVGHFGQRELRTIKPSVIQSWLRRLQQHLAPTYLRTVFTNVPAVFERHRVDHDPSASGRDWSLESFEAVADLEQRVRPARRARRGQGDERVDWNESWIHGRAS